eukprot:1322541-Amorphochlora_amoeboformis.AAC.1
MGLESKGIPTEKAIQRFAPSIHQLSVITSHPDLCSPAEYMEIFQSPLDFTLSNSRVWTIATDCPIAVATTSTRG